MTFSVTSHGKKRLAKVNSTSREMASQGACRMSPQEKALLIELVLEHKGILENKKTDAVSLETKAKCWQRLADKFNSHGYVSQRSWKQLRKAWDNVKMRRKRSHAEETRKRMGTGGGPYVPHEDPDSEITPQLEVTIPSITHCVMGVEDSDMLSDTLVGAEDVESLRPLDEEDAGPSHASREAVAQENRTTVVELVDFPESSGYLPTPHTSRGGTSRMRALEERLKKVEEAMVAARELHELRREVVALEKRAAEVKLQIHLEQLEENRAEARRKQELHDLQMAVLRRSLQQ